MQIGEKVQSSLRLTRTEIPIELHRNFAGLKYVPLFYSGYVKKLSHKGKVQSRILICTLDHLYCCHPNGDIFRCFPYSFIQMIFHDPQRKQLALIVPKEYDLCIAAHDTYHLIHVMETLRGLHRNEHAMEVRTLIRDNQNHYTALLGDGEAEEAAINAKQAKLAEESEFFAGSPTKPKPMQQKNIFTMLFSHVRLKWHEYKNQPKKRKGVIVGWNDAWADADHPQLKAGGPEELCLGKGYWSLRLMKPKDFQTELFYRPDGSIIPDSDESTDEEEEEMKEARQLAEKENGNPSDQGIQLSEIMESKEEKKSKARRPTKARK